MPREKSGLSPEITRFFVECFLGRHKVVVQIVLGVSAEGDTFYVSSLTKVRRAQFCFPCLWHAKKDLNPKGLWGVFRLRLATVWSRKSSKRQWCSHSQILHQQIVPEEKKHRQPHVSRTASLEKSICHRAACYKRKFPLCSHWWCHEKISPANNAESRICRGYVPGLPDGFRHHFLVILTNLL